MTGSGWRRGALIPRQDLFHTEATTGRREPSTHATGRHACISSQVMPDPTAHSNPPWMAARKVRSELVAISMLGRVVRTRATSIAAGGSRPALLDPATLFPGFPSAAL